jgi:DnaK suppressor protein
MSTSELNRFRSILTERFVELERLVRDRDGITVERSPDQFDEIQSASDRVLAVTNLDRNFDRIRNARAALRRIEQGSFGVCLACDHDIESKRLAAVPWASLCLHCQEAADDNPQGLPTQNRSFLLNVA